ncbi:hypothetical protein LP419_23075 [Massilia sp. H-1]|nr:hypothetical protein LP419_23075 [Massilia sp. H-1]
MITMGALAGLAEGFRNGVVQNESHHGDGGDTQSDGSADHPLDHGVQTFLEVSLGDDRGLDTRQANINCAQF